MPLMKALSALFSTLLASFALAADKPNLLFIFADDQAYDTIRALGNDEIVDRWITCPILH